MLSDKYICLFICYKEGMKKASSRLMNKFDELNYFSYDPMTSSNGHLHFIIPCVLPEVHDLIKIKNVKWI